MKKIVSCIILTILLSSCFGRPSGDEGETTGTGETEEKQSFFIETTVLKDFPTAYTIEKTGRLSSTQSVNVSSNASGKIQKINIQEGDTVRSGQLLATLADNIGNFNLNVERANNAVSRAKINYDSQRIALDNQIADATIALRGLNANLANLQRTNEQNIERNENDQANISTDEELARIDLNVEKIDQNIVKIRQNIERLEIDISTQELSDIETLSGFKNTIRNQRNALRLSLDDVIEFSDEILGLTEENQNENDDFQRFLGVRNLIQLQESESSLSELIRFRNGNFNDFLPEDISTMTDIQILRAIDTIENSYALIERHLEDLEITLQNSLPSLNLFSEATIDNLISNVNGFQSNNQAAITNFIAQKNQIVSFISTYETALDSIRKQIEILEQDIEILNKDKEILLNDRIVQERSLESAERNLDIGLESTITQGNDAVVSLENQIASTQLALENAQENKTVALQSLTNQIREAELNLEDAISQRDKLSIFAPIAGTVSSISVDVGQDVSNGTALFLIENTTSPEVVIGLTDEERTLVKVGTQVAVQYNGKAEKAEISSLSSIADSSLNYRTAIELSGNDVQVGEIVNVFIPISSRDMLVPLNIVDVDSAGTTGLLVIYDEKEEKFTDLRVQLGKNYGEDIEVLGCENPEYAQDGGSENIQQFIPCEFFSQSEIVISNVTNYDENTFKIVKKQ